MRGQGPLALAGALAVAVVGAARPAPVAQPSPHEAPRAASLEVTHVARALQPGEVVELRVTASSTLRSLEASAFGRVIPMWPDPGGARWLGLVGIDVEIAAGPHEVTFRGITTDGRAVAASHTLDVAAKAFRERHLTVDPRFSEPPASERPRIEREAARLEAIFGMVSRTTVPDVPLDAPVPQASSSPFGSRSFFNRQPHGRHNGVDFPSPAGTEIHAPGRGRIVLVDALYFTGNTVVIDHGFGVYTVFAHLERATTREGDDVRRGDLVGFVGATGRATGPHLHWSLRVQGARVDPLSLVKLPADLSVR